MSPVDALLRYPLFAVLGRAVLDAWCGAGLDLSAQTGQVLLEAGVPGRHVYVLLKGRVRVTRPGADDRSKSLEVLQPGEVFGEYALLPPHQSTATCRACEPAELFRLPLAVLQHALGLRRDLGRLKNWLRLHALVHYFRREAGLGFLSGPSLLLLLDRCREVAFGVTHGVQADGLLDDSWLFVRRGEVALHLPDQAAPRVLRPGDFLGEGALLGQGPLPLAVALADTVCWRLTRDDFTRGGQEVAADSHQTFVHPPRQGRAWEWLAQRTPADCGVAALAMALNGKGLEVTYEQLAPLITVGAGGASLAALSQAAERLGVQATAVRVGVEQLGQTRLPAVAHQSGGHYVSLFEIRRGEAVVGDPGRGVLVQSLDTFRQRWSGHLLLLRPSSVRH